MLDLSDSYWNITNEKIHLLNIKLKHKGRKLKDWDLSINYGIKTGLNEAFIINDEQREQLILKDNKNAEIIVPYLRGRDIIRFSYKHKKLWLINSHNGVKSKGIKPVNLKEDYPSIYKYIIPFEKKGTKRSDKGDHWTNLRNCAYLEDFNKEKLVYAETMRIHKSDISNFPRFGYDNDSMFCDKTTFIATGENIKFLLGVLNSKVGAYLIKEYVTKLDTGGYMMQKVFLEEIPIIKPLETNIVVGKVDEIIMAKKDNIDSDTKKLERELDFMVYNLYELTEEEIKILEESND